MYSSLLAHASSSILRSVSSIASYSCFALNLANALHTLRLAFTAEHVSRRPILDDLFCYDCVTRVWRRVDTTANGLRLQAELTAHGQHDAARIVAERAFQRPPPRRAHSLTAFTAMPLPPSTAHGSADRDGASTAAARAAQAAAPPHGKPNTALVVYGGVGVQPGRGDVTLGDLWLVDTTEPGRETFIRIHDQPGQQQVSADANGVARQFDPLVNVAAVWLPWSADPCNLALSRFRFLLRAPAAPRDHQGWRCPVRLRGQ